jgi:hypothetical protein
MYGHFGYNHEFTGNLLEYMETAEGHLHVIRNVGMYLMYLMYLT